MLCDSAELFLIFLFLGGEAKAKCVECEGDVPMPRSDHAVVGYDGKFMLLFGGKNYENEECYNDLYLLDLTSFEWWYVGEAGEEIDVRCGHSLGLLTGPGADAGVTYLVVFGGSSPETGTCSNDTYYAILPSSSSEISGKLLVGLILPCLLPCLHCDVARVSVCSAQGFLCYLAKACGGGWARSSRDAWDGTLPRPVHVCEWWYVASTATGALRCLAIGRHCNHFAVGAVCGH